MDLTRFRKYSITKVSDIFDIQFKHITTLFARTPMTRFEYSIQRKPIVIKRSAIIQTIVSYILILSMFILAHRLSTTFDAYIHVAEQVLKMDQYEDFIYTAIIGYTANEIIVAITFNEVYHYKCGLLDTASELAQNIANEFKCFECRKVINSFLRISTIDGISYKLAAYGLIPLVVHMNIQAVVDYMNDAITLIELIACWYLTIGINGYGAISMSLLFIGMPHLYIMIVVFKIKLKYCLFYAKFAIKTQSRTFLMKYVICYMNLHRLINVYNSFIRNHIVVHDMIFKMSGMVSLTFYIKQENRFNEFAYLILWLYVATYGTYLFVQSTLTYFPKRNDRLYRSLNGLSAKLSLLSYHHVTCSQRRCRRMSKFTIKSHLGEIRYLLILNRMCTFLGNNRFGFTYGRSYVITNSSIANALIGNFYMFVLFYKRLAV